MSGAIQLGGKLILFDANDCHLAPGSEAVIVNEKGKIVVARLEPTAEWERLARSRTGLVRAVNPLGEQVLIGVKVLGRYIRTEDVGQAVDLAPQKPDFFEDAQPLTSTEVAGELGKALAVCTRIYHHPDKADTDNCERSLRAAAHGIMQMWNDVQRIKQERTRQLGR
ncbi:hypothetical protein [Komagataeibacter sp. FNDCF1]|uniref:hypothetical protein n=1 Tax=Komagataeibacter sp. FNDCF1 TaxID=2878681 RepID=UPI001E5DA136|nr:hypothetical protein [Komagataeibacter sp. FNDCF1]MCE2564168.1 hypothetical protein [Komagataeibacter sp. FNDCF1]